MKYKWLPVFNLENCIGCEACVPECASGLLGVVDGVVNFKNPENCLSDELCVQACPSEVIRMEWVPIIVSSSVGKFTEK